MKKVLSMLLVCTMVISMLMGCSNKENVSDTSAETSAASDTGSDADSQEETKNEEKVVLDCLHWKPEATDAFNKLAEEFNKLHPNITVEFSGVDSYKQTLMGRLAANDAPDLIATPSGNYGFDVAKGGYMLDLSDSEYLSRLKDELVESQRYDGKIYSIPIDVAAHGVIYNREIFEKLNLSIPTTWDEFLQVCETIKQNNIVPLVIAGKDDWTLGILGLTLAAPVYGEDPEFDMNVINGKKSYTDPVWQNVMNQYKTLIDNYANEDYASLDYGLGNQMIANGEAAMVIQGIWDVSAIQQYNPDIDLGIFPLMNSENPDNNCLIWGPDLTIGVSADSPNQEEALMFLDFLTSKEAAQIWTDNAKTFSAVKDSDMEFNQIAKDINGFLNTGIKTYPLVQHMWFMDNVCNDWTKSLQEFNNGSIEAVDSLQTLEDSVKGAYDIYSKE